MIGNCCRWCKNIRVIDERQFELVTGQYYCKFNGLQFKRSTIERNICEAYIPHTRDIITKKKRDLSRIRDHTDKRGGVYPQTLEQRAKRISKVYGKENEVKDE